MTGQRAGATKSILFGDMLRFPLVVLREPVRDSPVEARANGIGPVRGALRSGGGSIEDADQRCVTDDDLGVGQWLRAPE